MCACVHVVQTLQRLVWSYMTSRDTLLTACKKSEFKVRDNVHIKYNVINGQCKNSTPYKQVAMAYCL